MPPGTPAGIYYPAASQPNGPPQFAVFEDHDTNSGYVAVPSLTASIFSAPANPGSVVIPAGPRYNGRNDVPPGMNGNQILPITGEGILRTRAITSPTTVEFLPHTNPAINLKVTVSETPLTGLIPDFATSAFGLDGVFTGLLPGIDAVPFFDGTRPAAALTPASFRGRDGKVHVYFVRNGTSTAASTGAGQPMRLFHTYLNWNASLGAFQAALPGVPLADPTANQGRWFTTASGAATEELPAPGGGVSNLEPNVLQTDPLSDTAPNFLFWVQSEPVAGGIPTEKLMYAPLNIDGNTGGIGRDVMSTIAYDPNIRRHGPRAVYDNATETGFLFYYGGLPGKWTLRYVPFGIRGTTLTTGFGRRGSELNLTLSTALTSASEPTAIVRRLNFVNHDPGRAPVVPNDANMPVIDVYYTGVLRTNQTPDLMMTRYRLNTDNSGNIGAAQLGSSARLVPVGLPTITNERLVQNGRELVWQARHIGWNRNLAPTVTVNPGKPNTFTTDPTKWEYDNNSQRFAQVIKRPAGVVYAYVDTEAGVVSFRGAGAPGPGDEVFATYQPTTYRLTPDSATDTGAVLAMDTRVVPAGTGVYPGVIRRPGTALLSKETNPNLSGVGRLWTQWQKGAQPNRPSALYYAARRMGVDLKSVLTQNGMSKNESILLTSKDANGNQTPVVNAVGIELVPGSNAFTNITAVDIDYVHGRIFVDPIYEGLRIQVAYTATAGDPTTNANRTALGQLAFIEELNATDTSSMGLQAPLQRNINEGQVATFLDLYNYDPAAYNALTNPYMQGTAGSGRAAGNLAPLRDPTLLPGRLWMFWTSSRPRTGRIIDPGTGQLVALPSGFDLFYQTLAPNFESPSFSGLN